MQSQGSHPVAPLTLRAQVLSQVKVIPFHDTHNSLSTNLCGQKSSNQSTNYGEILLSKSTWTKRANVGTLVNQLSHDAVWSKKWTNFKLCIASQLELKNNVTLCIIIILICHIFHRKRCRQIFSHGKYRSLTFETVSIINEMHIRSLSM